LGSALPLSVYYLSKLKGAPHHQAMSVGNMAVEASVAIVATGSAAFMAFGIFGPVTGGGMDPKGWFPWHPVLMSLSFPCLMLLGRWSYIAGDRPLDSQRKLHALLMALATIAMLIGYLAIFQSHLELGKFFGYDFKKKVWSDPLRILHVYLGYALILGVLAQAVIGARKMQFLAMGQRILTFHGTLGKALIVGGAVNVAVAVLFWGWTTSLKVPLYALSLLAAVFGGAWPRPAKTDAEDQSLIRGEAA